MSDLDCPICGKRLDPQVLKKVGLDAISAEMLHEKAHSGKLVPLVQLGSIAENYLKPERFKAEAEILKVVERLMEKQRQFVKDVAEAGEDERTQIVERYEKELAEGKEEMDSIHMANKEVLEGIRDDLAAIGKKIVGVGIGKVGEFVTIKDLQAAFISDEFNDRRSDENGSDIVAEVREGTLIIGKAVISVKYQEKWSGSFLDQLKKNLSEEGTRWGMLVTRVFPANALSDKADMTKEGYFIVKPEYASVAYYGLRMAIKEAWEAAKQAKTVEERMKEEERIIEALRDWVSGDRFREVSEALDRARKAAEEAQDLVRKWQVYTKNQGDRVNEKNREIVEELARSMGLLDDLKDRLGSQETPVLSDFVGAKKARKPKRTARS